MSCFGITEAASSCRGATDDTLEQRDDGPAAGRAGDGVPDRRPGHRRRAAAGYEGELLVRGPTCSPLPNDLGDGAGIDADGWYHSVDLARMDPDGRVSFVGRLKDMLKVGGENVAAAEVEGYLVRHPAVGIVQVVAAPDDHYVEVPAASSSSPGADGDRGGADRLLRGQIASFKVPRYVRFVDEWPMSGTKIQKARLREMIAADLKEKGISRAPKISTVP